MGTHSAHARIHGNEQLRTHKAGAIGSTAPKIPVVQYVKHDGGFAHDAGRMRGSSEIQSCGLGDSQLAVVWGNVYAGTMRFWASRLQPRP